MLERPLAFRRSFVMKNPKKMSNEELLMQFVEDVYGGIVDDWYKDAFKLKNEILERMNETKLPSGLVIPSKGKEPEFNHNIDLCDDCLGMISRLTGKEFEELTIGYVFPCFCSLCGVKTKDLHMIRKSGIVNAMRKAT
jgi:hypothetical protein